MSETQICNLALAELGAAQITSLTDNTTEAKLCALWYEPARDAVLHDGVWSFATARAALVADATAPSWGYSTRFLLPNNTLHVFEVYDDPEDPQPTIHRWEVEGDYLLADRETVWIRYVQRIEDVTRFRPLFTQALVYRLAAELAVPIVQSRALKDGMEQLYQQRLQAALNTDGMQGHNRRVTSRGRMTTQRGAYYGRGLRR